MPLPVHYWSQMRPGTLKIASIESMNNKVDVCKIQSYFSIVSMNMWKCLNMWNCDFCDTWKMWWNFVCISVFASFVKILPSYCYKCNSWTFSGTFLRRWCCILDTSPELFVTSSVIRAKSLRPKEKLQS